jgi:hypothetical protein
MKHRFVYFLLTTDCVAICFRMPLVGGQLLLLLAVMTVACSMCTDVRAQRMPQHSGQHDDIAMAGDWEDKPASGQVAVSIRGTGRIHI